MVVILYQVLRMTLEHSIAESRFVELTLEGYLGYCHRWVFSTQYILQTHAPSWRYSLLSKDRGRRKVFRAGVTAKKEALDWRCCICEKGPWSRNRLASANLPFAGHMILSCLKSPTKRQLEGKQSTEIEFDNLPLSPQPPPPPH